MENFLGQNYVVPALTVRNKATLTQINKRTHHLPKPLSQDLCNDFVRHITKADGSKIADANHWVHLRHKSYQSLIYFTNLLWMSENVLNQVTNGIYIYTHTHIGGVRRTLFPLCYLSFSFFLTSLFV